MITLDEYFAYEHEPRLTGEALYALLDEQSVLSAMEGMLSRGENECNVYFKLLAQLLYLEKDLETHRDEAAYLCYLIGYVLGLFLHPANGDQLAISYLHRAMALKDDVGHLSRCLETLRMIEGRV